VINVSIEKYVMYLVAAILTVAIVFGLLWVLGVMCFICGMAGYM